MQSNGQNQHPNIAVEEDEKLEMYEPESPDEDIETAPQDNGIVADDAVVNWKASEYVRETRGWYWYLLFAVVVSGLIALGWYLKTWTFSALVIVMAVSLIIYINRSPREIDYALSVGQGLYVGDKLYHFNDFKAFGLIQDGKRNSIFLIPVKRFELGVSVYFPDEVGEKIVDILGARLSMQDVELDAFDNLIRKLRL